MSAGGRSSESIQKGVVRHDQLFASQAQARIRDLEALCKLHQTSQRNEREVELEINRLVHRVLDAFSSEVLTPVNREEPSLQQ